MCLNGTMVVEEMRRIIDVTPSVGRTTGKPHISLEGQPRTSVRCSNVTL